MAHAIDYYLTLNSPWTYLGHARLVDLARERGIAVRIHPVDMGGTVFPATGGLPVGKRAPQRQAYRLAELDRWRRHLDVPLELHPAHWPADERLAAGMVLHLRETGADPMPFAGAVMRAVWAEQRDVADPGVLGEIAAACGHDADALVEAGGEGRYAELRAAESAEAIERGVFGAPTYVWRDEIFWGQDRLDFLARTLDAG